MKRMLCIAAVACAALAALPAASRAAQAPRPASPVVEWNQFLLDLQATPGDQPATIHPTYDLAVMHAAIYDAVASIDGGAPYLAHLPAPRRASDAAAADTAAHDTLVALYPGLRATIDAKYAATLGRLRGGLPRAEGVLVGRLAAAVALRARAHDGSDAPPVPFTPGTQPGDYQLTPPGFVQPVFTQWAGVRPFVLRRASEFRPPAPPALTSAKYAAAIAEVQALGPATGSTRTADQTQIGLFWNPPIWAAWNRIAQTAALGHRGDLLGDARTFAALNLTFADSVIAFYDAKYTYRFWRPVTAIRATSDPAWTPLSNTAPDPSYPGAHGTIAAAGADVLAALYGNDFAFDLTSTALPGVERSFTSFSEAAEEASVSRIYNGNHTRVDQVAGENLGHDVAGFVLGHAFRR
jgi:PAP2 superfamily protein